MVAQSRQSPDRTVTAAVQKGQKQTLLFPTSNSSSSLNFCLRRLSLSLETLKSDEEWHEQGAFQVTKFDFSSLLNVVPCRFDNR